MGAVEAIGAARLAVSRGGQLFVSLDKVVAPVLRTREEPSEMYEDNPLGISPEVFDPGL